MKVKQYDIIKILYESSKTVIYLAKKADDGYNYVIKMPNEEYPETIVLDRIRKEYNLLDFLKGTVSVEPIELIEEGNSLALVMERFGECLSTSQQIVRMGIQEKTALFIKLSVVLDAVHRKGVIHKDVNPSNFLINESGEVRIIDFGLACNDEDCKLEADLEGTLAYTSPEQTGRLNRPIDQRTDYYALGATFYQLLTGRTLFAETKDRNRIIHQQIARTAASPKMIRPEVPDSLSRIVMKLVEKNPDDRYQSLSGLIHDLQRVMLQPSEDDFELGIHDHSEHFIVSSKLLGRQQQLETLMRFCRRVGEEQSPILLISGPDGVGRTALMKALKKNAEREGILFAMAGFEIQRADTPYHGLLDAFQNLIDHLLVSDEDVLKIWRNRLVDALGRNGRVLTELIPQLESLIGVPEPISLLGSEESQKRFFKVFSDFIRVFASKRHPLVVCLDDAHQISSGTLELLTHFLTTSKIGNVHFIFTSRQESVNDTLPLIHTLHQLRNDGIQVDEMKLSELTCEQVQAFLTDSRIRTDDVDLATEVHRKTQGNPLYMQYLIKYCHDKGYLEYDDSTKQFVMDLTRLVGEDFPDKLTDLMINELDLQSFELRNFLGQVALLGYQFSFEMMHLVCEDTLTLEEQLNLLFMAVDQGFLIISKLAVGGDDVSYQFVNEKLHHTVLNRLAAYRELPEHYLKYARTFVTQLGINSDDFEMILFDVCGYYNKAISCVKDEVELQVIAELNHRAGIRAKKAVANGIAYDYLKKAEILYLHDQQGPLWVDLYSDLAELAYLNGCTEEMNGWIASALGNTKEAHENSRAYIVQIKAWIGAGDREKALDYAVEVLSLLGLNLPRRPNKVKVFMTLSGVKAKLGRHPLEKLKALTPMTDPTIVAMMEIMSCVSSSAYLTCPELYLVIALKQMELAIQYGDSDIAYNAYTLYGMVLCGMLKDYGTGFDIGRLAMEKCATLAHNRMEPRIHVHYGLFIGHYKESAKAARSRVEFGGHMGLGNGDYEYAAWGFFMGALYDFYQGRHLDAVIMSFDDCESRFAELNQQTQYQLASVWKDGLAKLTQPEIQLSLTDEDQQMAAHLRATHQSYESSLFYFHLNQMIRCYLHGGFESAVEASANAEIHLNSIVSTISVQIYWFYDALIKLALIHQGHGNMGKMLKSVRNTTAWFKTFSDLAPVNHRHRWLLLSAEMAALDGHYEQATRHYNEAIAQAHHNEWLSDEAIATELAAQFYHKQDQEFIARNYIKKSMYLFHKWGLENKVQLMSETYTDLIMVRTSMDYADVTLSTASMVSSAMMDISSVIKATQALSTEINEDRLIRSFMRIISENAGADKAVLFVMSNKEPEVRAYWLMENDGHLIGDEGHEIVFDASYSHFPKQVVNYTSRTMNEIILTYDQMDERFAQDPYIEKHQPKSVMCIPMVLQKKLKGMLYLENHTTPHAFKRAQGELVEAISTQLAISLVNSKLYAHLEEEVKDRTMALSEITNRYRRLSITDQLTGLLNRREMDDKLRYEHARIKRYGGEMSIILLDIDHFKKVNDTFGHMAGDQALIAFAELLKQTTREADYVGRWGGEEFMILCPVITQDQACVLAEKIRKELEVLSIPDVGHITASFGVASYKENDTIEKMVHRADVAMYEAKRGGRNQVRT